MENREGFAWTHLLRAAQREVHRESADLAEQAATLALLAIGAKIVTRNGLQWQ